jgi:hypothetical protein
MVKENKKNLWQQMGRDVSEDEEMENSKPYDWSKLKSRLIGDKNTADTATEEIEKLKKKQNY